MPQNAASSRHGDAARMLPLLNMALPIVNMAKSLCHSKIAGSVPWDVAVLQHGGLRQADEAEPVRRYRTCTYALRRPRWDAGTRFA